MSRFHCQIDSFERSLIRPGTRGKIQLLKCLKGRVFMALKQQLREEMKQAMRAHDAEKLGVIRFLLAEIKNVEIDQGELDDRAIQKIVAKQIKQMKDAISQFEGGGRHDLVATEKAKIAILETYLPQQLSQVELAQVVDQVIAQVGENKHLGEIIGLVMKRTAGRAEGSRVRHLVNERLTGHA